MQWMNYSNTIFKINAYTTEHWGFSYSVYISWCYVYLLDWFLAAEVELYHSCVCMSNTIVRPDAICVCMNMKWVNKNKQHKNTQTKTEWEWVESKP